MTPRYRINLHLLSDQIKKSVGNKDSSTGRMRATGSAGATGRVDALEGSHARSETDRMDATQTVIDSSIPTTFLPSAGRTRPCVVRAVESLPVQQIVELYHEVLPELPRIRLLPDSRLKTMRRRWVSLSKVKRPAKGLDWASVASGFERARALKFFVTDQGGLTINLLRSKARNIKRLYGLSVLVVDYIGLMVGLDTRQPRAYQVEEISRGLKTLAKELDIAIVCLAQVNRKVDERTDATPSLSDLRDSGAIEQDADVVMFLHRPIQTGSHLGEGFKHYAKLNVAKNRNGSCGVLNLYYESEQTRFEEWNGEPPSSSMGSRPRGGGL